MAEVPASQAQQPALPVAYGGKNRNTKLYTSTDSKVSFSSSLSAQLETLAQNLQSKVAASAAFAGSDLLYKEMRRLVPVETGKLYGAIYQYHNDALSTSSRHIYSIGPNKREAPHWWNVEYGHWRYNRSVGGKFLRSKEAKDKNKRGPEYHTIQAGMLKERQWVVGIPYTRMTADRMPDAIAAMKKRFAERIKELQEGKE
jgi:hypothetical protein